MNNETQSIEIPGYKTVGMRMPQKGEWYIAEDGKPRQCQRSHRKTVAVVLIPTAPKPVELPYDDCAIGVDGQFHEPGSAFMHRDFLAFCYFPRRLIGYVYADGSVRGEPYRFQSAVDPVELPVAVRIKKESAK